MATEIKKEQVNGQIRALLAAFGGLMLALGYDGDAATTQAAVEGAMASIESYIGLAALILPMFWSWISKKNGGAA